MSALRQSRSARRPGVRVELGARDERLLRALARFGIARTPDLARLIFAGVRPDTVAVRLRKLFDADWLSVRVLDRSLPNVYALGPRGRAWAQDQGLSIAREPRGGLAHHLLIVSAWVRLSAGCHGRRDVRLVRFRADWELRRNGGSSGLDVVPDAFVELEVLQGRIRFALEIDRGGERPRAWREKLERYRLTLVDAEATVNFGLVLVHEGGPRRHVTLTGLVSAWEAWALVVSASALDDLLDQIVAAGSPYCLPIPAGVLEARK